MFTILAQRALFRLPAFSGSLLLRSRATSIVLHPVVTRAFGSTPQLAFPKEVAKAATKTKSGTAGTKKTSTKKTTAKKVTPKKRKVAAKKPAKANARTKKAPKKIKKVKE